MKLLKKSKYNIKDQKPNNPGFLSILLFLSTIFIYLFIICYNEAFFSRFSFPYEHLVMPITFYLINLMDVLFLNFTFFLLMIVTIMLVCIILFNFIKVLNKPLKSNKLILPKIALTITPFFMYILYLFRKSIIETVMQIDYQILHANDEVLFYFLLSFYIYICFWCYFERFNLIEKLKHMLKVGKITKLHLHVFLLLFLVSFIFFNDYIIVYIGINDATSMVEGEKVRYEGDSGRYELKLIQNNTELNFLNKTLIFFTQQDGNYYFVEKQVPAPPRVSLYSIPVNKIEMANLTLI